VYNLTRGLDLDCFHVLVLQVVVMKMRISTVEIPRPVPVDPGS